MAHQDHHQEVALQEVARLEAQDAAPGAPSFPARAEAQRRAGRPDEARRIAEEGLAESPQRLAGRVALALALIDLGEIESAKDELGAVLATEPGHPVARAAWTPLQGEAADALPAVVAEGEAAAESPLAALDEAELEDAFAEAEAEPDEMMTANHVAEAALRAVEDGGPEGVRLDEDSPFATETVASLLEEQGDAASAEAIRSTLARRAPQAPADFDRERVVATLERWLDNLRRSKR